jgi:hypothetical protein
MHLRDLRLRLGLYARDTAYQAPQLSAAPAEVLRWARGSSGPRPATMGPRLRFAELSEMFQLVGGLLSIVAGGDASVHRGLHRKAPANMGLPALAANTNGRQCAAKVLNASRVGSHTSVFINVCFGMIGFGLWITGN